MAAPATRLPKLLVALAGIAVAGIWWLARDGHTTASSSEVDAHGRRPTDVRAPRPALVSRAPAVTENQPPPNLDTAVGTETAAAEVPRVPSVAEQRDYLQTRFASEQIDPGWAATARRDLENDLGRLGSKDVRVQGVECRVSLCRAEIVVASREVGNVFLESWLRTRTWTGPGFASTDEASWHDSPRMIVFLGRPGTELPMFE